MTRLSVKAAVLVVILLAATGPGAAQQAAAPATRPSASSVSAEPENTTATFADWTLRCQRVGDGAQSKRTCEISQIIQTKNQQGQQIPFAQIALGYPTAGQPAHLVVVVPVSVSFPSVAILATDDKDVGVEAAWSRCLPAGCFAEVPVKDEVLRRWRTFGEPGHLTFKDAGGRELRVATSYRGVGPALDALAKAAAAH